MHARTGDRGEIDHGAPRPRQLRDKPACQEQWRVKVGVEHRLPGVDVRFQRIQPRSVRALGRNAGIIDQCVQLPVDEHAAHDLHATHNIIQIGQIKQDVGGRHAPRTLPRRGAARHGNDAPTFGVEAQRRRVADAARGTGNNDRPLPRHGSTLRSLSRRASDGVHARPLSFTIDHVSSSARPKHVIISSISVSLMISGGLKATTSPGMLRSIAP